MKDSVEERIILLQQKKRDMTSTALSGQFRKGKSRKEIKEVAAPPSLMFVRESLSWTLPPGTYEGADGTLPMTK
jgi:hypothetical protein